MCTSWLCKTALNLMSLQAACMYLWSFLLRAITASKRQSEQKKVCSL